MATTPTIQRAYSLILVKGIDERRRILSGTATTPSTDRVGDVIEPFGATFAAEVPLLLHHRADTPVGTARLQRATKDGIDFEAELPIIEEPGRVKEEVDSAWISVVHRLIRGVSIGFRSLDGGVEALKTGGLRFLKYEILELSLVSIPANQDATLAVVKSLDASYLAQSGSRHAPSGTRSSVPVVRVRPAALPVVRINEARPVVRLSEARPTVVRVLSPEELILGLQRRCADLEKRLRDVEARSVRGGI